MALQVLPKRYLNEITVEGTIPDLTYDDDAANTFDLSSLTITGTDQYGHDYALDADEYDWRLTSDKGYAAINGNTITGLVVGMDTVTLYYPVGKDDNNETVYKQSLPITVKVVAKPYVDEFYYNGGAPNAVEGMAYALTQIPLMARDQHGNPFNVPNDIVWKLADNNETEATLDFIKERKPYFTVVATGSQPEKQPIEGLSDEKYFTAQEILQMPEEKIAEMLQGTVAILGGGAVGLETAAFLAQRLPEGAAEFGIKIIEQKEKMGMDMGAMARPLLNELKKKNVSFLTTTTATLMDGSKLYVKIGEMTLFVSADTVIWAGGGEPVVDTELTMWLMDERMSYAVVGDANEIGDGGTAIKDAYELYTHLYLA